MTVRYEIRVSGRLGPALCAAFAGTRAEVVPGQTVIAGSLSRDELRALLLRMEEVGAHLVRLDSTVGSPPSSDIAHR
jgi:hypothetical protein